MSRHLNPVSPQSPTWQLLTCFQTQTCQFVNKIFWCTQINTLLNKYSRLELMIWWYALDSQLKQLGPLNWASRAEDISPSAAEDFSHYRKDIDQFETGLSLKIDEGFITNPNWQDKKWTWTRCCPSLGCSKLVNIWRDWCSETACLSQKASLAFGSVSVFTKIWATFHFLDCILKWK